MPISNSCHALDFIVANGQQRVGPLAALPRLLDELGHDPASVTNAAGLEADVLSSPENVIGFREMGTVLAVAAERTGCEHIGILLGQRTSLRHLGLVARLMETAPSAKHAIIDLMNSQPRYVSGAVVYVHRASCVVYFGYAVYLQNVVGIDYIYDVAMSFGLRILKELGVNDVFEVRFARAKPANAKLYQTYMGSKVAFDAEQYAFVLNDEALSRAPPQADPAAHAAASRELCHYQLVRPMKMSEHILRQLRFKLLFEPAGLDDTARHLAVHPRTLHRRLSSEGTSFHALSETVRAQIARQLLAGTDMELTQIAHSLGYSDSSAFAHAFKRWTGICASQWRARESRSASA
jgi:AraC-like DNA-binding protein